MTGVKTFPTIKTVRTFVIDGVGSGGDYHNVKGGHWLIDNKISTPMAKWEQYRKSRTSFGINVLGSFCVEIEATDGTKGFATGFGGPPACWLVQQHFERFLLGRDPRDVNDLYELMYKGSMFYGRKGLPVAVISVLDLALWDLLGKIRNEPVYKMIGGATRDRLDFYCTGPEPAAAQKMGFVGGKVPLPYSPEEPDSLKKNIAFLKKHREDVGLDFPLRVDCWMSLNVQYTIELVAEAKRQDIRIDWWEEVLSPDDFDGFQLLKRAHPDTKFTTGVSCRCKITLDQADTLLRNTNIRDMASASFLRAGMSTSFNPTSCGWVASPSFSKSRPWQQHTIFQSFHTPRDLIRTILS